MFPPVDTKNPPAVAAFIVEKFAALHPGANPAWLQAVFRDVLSFFSGRHPDYAALDLRYHDIEHTMQATVCEVLLLEGRAMAGAAPPLTVRQVELAVAAALLHDTGYLKLRSDHSGTGAKYTFCHVLRSCVFAAAYLPTVGADDLEVESVINAINCTGPAKEISRLPFREPFDRFMGCALATADFLGQMAAADYPDELEILHAEFLESDDFLRLPESRRSFKSPRDLAQRTPAFWEKFVRPKLDADFQGVHRFLARPVGDGPNLYLDAVEKNIAVIRSRAAVPTR